MPIQVTCPGCMARFTVSDKYAGKKGPCPKCKQEIVIPDKSQEVVIHAPESSGPKDSKGVAVLKPIKRVEFQVGWKTWVGVAVGSILVLAVALAVRLEALPPAGWLLTIGAILLAPPLAMLAYTFLRDDELEGYTGQEYLIRIAVCTLVFPATWLFYYALAHYLDNRTLADVPIMQMAMLMVGMIVLGTVTSLAALELELGQSAMHYLTYFGATLILCLIMGIELGEPLAKAKPKVSPTVNQPLLPLPMKPQGGKKEGTPKGASVTPPVPPVAPKNK